MTARESLHTIISNMSDFSKRSNMVAINAAIRASKLTDGEGAAFQLLAREIQEMSTVSNEKIKQLDTLVQEIANLSRLVNVTGSQRMLLMKIVNAKTLSLNSVLEESISTFAHRLTYIKKSPINTQSSDDCLQRIESMWLDYECNIRSIVPMEAFNQANAIIEQINVLIDVYEKY